MATKKKTKDDISWIDHAQKELDKIRALPLIATTYYVEEVCPHYDDRDDQYWPAKSRKVSPYFDSREHESPVAAVNQWVEEHDPDPWDGRDTTFEIRKRFLRTYVENRWGPI